MSDTNTPATKELLQYEKDLLSADYKLNAVSELYERELGDGMKFVANPLTGPLAGLCYITLQSASEDQSALDAMINRWGVEGVVNLANTAARNAQRNKARNSGLPAEPSDTWVAQRCVADPIFWKQADAEGWKPGQRDITVTGYNKLIQAAIERSRDKSASQEERLVAKNQAREFMRLRNDLQERQIEEDTEQ